MRTVSVVLILLIGFLFVVPVTAQDVEQNDNPPEPVNVSEECRRVVDGIDALHTEVNQTWPDSFLNEDGLKIADAFDVNTYLTLFDQIAVEDGYLFNYVHNGAPLMYTAPADSSIATWDDYVMFYEDSRPDYQDHLLIEDTPEGYVQMSVLDVMGGQFYLVWHANYNDWQVICDTEMLDNVLATLEEPFFGLPIPADAQNAARELDLTPTVTLYDDVAEIHVVLFTKWGGFFEETLIIDRQFLRERYEAERENLVPYDCGVMF